MKRFSKLINAIKGKGVNEVNEWKVNEKETIK